MLHQCLSWGLFSRPMAPDVGLRPTSEKIGGPQARIFGRVGLRHMSPMHAHTHELTKST